MSASPVPLPPLEVITANDKAGLIVLITALLLSFVFLCLGARIYTRIYINGPWMRDDDILTAATVESHDASGNLTSTTDTRQATCCVQSALVFFQVSKGYGKAGDLLDTDDIGSIAKVGSIAGCAGLEVEHASDGYRLAMPPPCSILSVCSYPNAPWPICFCVYRQAEAIPWLLGRPYLDRLCGRSCPYFSLV